MSIYRDSKDRSRWRWDFDRWIKGRRIRRSRLLPAGWTRAQADAFDRKESSAVSALAEGIAKPRWLIGEAVERYLKERAPALKNGRNLRGELVGSPESGLACWYAGRSVDELAEVCAEYARDQADHLAPATIKNRIAYLRAACRWAWKRHGMGEADPGARIVVPTVRNERDTTITRRQMLELCRACEHRGVRALIRILYYSGMRVGEAVRARRVPGAFVLTDTKNGSAHVVPMHPRVTSAAKVPMPARPTIRYWWEVARTACGLEHVHLHDLRHTTASEIIAAGGDLGDVGAVLNHRSAASSKRYAHWLLERKAAALAKVGRRA